MSTISEFPAHGRIYNFEPPVNIGNHRADSLARIAAIACAGPESPEFLIDMCQQQTEVVLAHAGEDARMVREQLQGLVGDKHIVRIK